ncbi:MAG TPA: choice-of-anchor tandem repeat GloVer-containing protein [Verrucomicrobiae bacterium]|nr:choice-of-anchor tandem repeat GloVer-containing protein [Verrucomicrobiae bacterium]
MNSSSQKPEGKLFLGLALLAMLAWTMGDCAKAQTFAVLHTFGPTGVNGAYPDPTLLLSGNVLYGVAGGGLHGEGTVFSMNINGTGFTNLYDFSGGADGGLPNAGLILSGNVLYGTATSAGASGGGTLYRINTDGSAFTNLHNFTFSDGTGPRGELLLLGDTLYGTTQAGGVDYANAGTVFAINVGGTGYTKLHVFGGGNDGCDSYSGLIASGDVLYGTASGCGAGGWGVVFTMNTNGAGFSVPHSFPGAHNEPQTEGIEPCDRLVLANNTLYGTTYQGGNAGKGLVFSLTTDGTTYTKLHDFTAPDTAVNPPTNTDGALPSAGLLLIGDTLYGTSIHGGASGYGTLFSIKTNGTGFTNLHSFTINDGAYPYSRLVLGSNNTLYGTTHIAGNGGYGTIFSLSLATVTLPKLTIALTGTNIVLAWPTNAPGFTLQFTTNLAAPAVWSTNTSVPAIFNGYYTVTDSISGIQKFYRLIQ